ncbi:hypothetical protein D3C73_988310 [compost metagenome]
MCFHSLKTNGPVPTGSFLKFSFFSLIAAGLAMPNEVMAIFCRNGACGWLRVNCTVVASTAFTSLMTRLPSGPNMES